MPDELKSNSGPHGEKPVTVHAQIMVQIVGEAADLVINAQGLPNNVAGRDMAIGILFRAIAHLSSPAPAQTAPQIVVPAGVNIPNLRGE